MAFTSPIPVKPQKPNFVSIYFDGFSGDFHCRSKATKEAKQGRFCPENGENPGCSRVFLIRIYLDRKSWKDWPAFINRGCYGTKNGS